MCLAQAVPEEIWVIDWLQPSQWIAGWVLCQLTTTAKCQWAWLSADRKRLPVV